MLLLYVPRISLAFVSGRGGWDHFPWTLFGFLARKWMHWINWSLDEKTSSSRIFLKISYFLRSITNVAILLIYALFVPQKMDDHLSGLHSCQNQLPTINPSPKKSPPIPRKSLRCVLPMPMRQMVEMELPFFYWDPWQNTAAGGGCGIHRLGREGEKLGQNDFQFGRFAGGKSWKGESWDDLWWKHGAVSDMNVTIAMMQKMIMRIETEMHAKHLLCDISEMYQYVSYADTTNNNRSIITISQWREFSVACSEFGVANLWSLSATVCGFLHLNDSTPRVFPSGLMPSNTSSLMVPGWNSTSVPWKTWGLEIRSPSPTSQTLGKAAGVVLSFALKIP